MVKTSFIYLALCVVLSFIYFVIHVKTKDKKVKRDALFFAGIYSALGVAIIIYIGILL